MSAIDSTSNILRCGPPSPEGWMRLLREIHKTQLYPVLCEIRMRRCAFCERTADECEQQTKLEHNPITDWRGFGTSCDECYNNYNHEEEDDTDSEEELECECCKDPYGSVWKINGILVCEKCNNFECGVCFRETEDYDVEWCEKLKKCVCSECFK